MQRLAGLLCPRSPPRVAGAAGYACAFALLVEADSIDNLANAAVRLARQATRCAHAEFVLSDDIQLTHPSAPGNTDSGISISLADARAQLQLRFTAADLQRDDWSDADCAWIDLVELRLRELLQQRELRNDIASARSNEYLQRALYSIADLSYADIDVPEMLARVHQVVARLTYAENFFVALYDETLDSLYFPYYVGIDDPASTTALTRLSAADYPSSLTFAVMHTGKSLLGPSLDLRASLGLTPDDRLGPECVDWLGVPMLEGDKVRGVVVVQATTRATGYSEDDATLA